MLRVQPVPAAHPYVRHLLDPDGVGDVVHLPDVEVPGRPAGEWWPPAAVDPAWVAANAGRFDVLHLHFGLETFAPAHLVAVTDALRDAGRPLVHTVHDLVHPQLVDQAAHVAALEVVVGAADGLVTLTDAAADVVAARFGRRPEVLPHPHLHPLDAPFPPAGEPDGPPVVGVHLRDLRPNVDGPGTIAALRSAAHGARVRLRVLLNDRVRDAAARDAVVTACGDDVELVVRSRPGDGALAAELAGLDVAVLPYRHGTHSGWVELCWDLGVPVLTAPVGCFAAQHPDDVFGLDADGLGAALARPAVDLAARREVRRAQRRAVAAAHRDLCARVAGR